MTRQRKRKMGQTIRFHVRGKRPVVGLRDPLRDREAQTEATGMRPFGEGLEQGAALPDW